MTKDEFDHLVFTNQSLIWKICRSYSENEEDRKDMFQDILYKLWLGKESYSGESKFTTWMYKVSLNHAIDQSRRRKIVTTDVDQCSLPIESTGSGYDLEALYLAIKKLSPLNRAIIILHLDQLSYSEIGEIIGITEKNVSVKLVRIRKELKENYLRITNIIES